MNSFTSIFQGFCWNYDLSIFLSLLFRNTYFKEHLLLSGYCCNIVSNILIIKRSKKIFSFSQKHLAKNRTFLSENFKAKAKLQNVESRECYEKFSGKKSFYFHFLFLFFIFYFHIFILYFLIFIFIFFHNLFWLKRSSPV